MKSDIVAGVTLSQMCLGTIGTYILRTWSLGRSVVTTSVLGSGASTLVTPAFET